MKHLCGQCKKGFDTEGKYLKHVCKITGFKPTEIDNLGEGFKAISEAALERGNKKANK